jgi:hypothetical protein
MWFAFCGLHIASGTGISGMPGAGCRARREIKKKQKKC